MSLNLDARQRAMLHEMGVRVWWPEAAAPVPGEAMPNAINLVAAHAELASAAGQNHMQNAGRGVPMAAAAPAMPASVAAVAAPVPADDDLPWVDDAPGSAPDDLPFDALPSAPPPAARRAPGGIDPAPGRPARVGPPTTQRVDAASADLQASAAPASPPVEAASTRALAAGLDWPGLQAAVAGCRACGLCERRHRTVYGVGPAPAQQDSPPRVDWLVVGEAPGEQEDLQGEPFVGKAGQLLDQMLKAVELSRHGADGLDGAYIANAIKCRPPGNRNPTPQELLQCTPYLERQIALLQPRIILALGRFAAQTLLAEAMPEERDWVLGRLRRRVHRYRGIPVVVSYHPAYLLRSPAEKAKAWADLCLAQAELKRA